jgi:uncharacterized membrane protein
MVVSPCYRIRHPALTHTCECVYIYIYIYIYIERESFFVHFHAVASISTKFGMLVEDLPMNVFDI